MDPTVIIDPIVKTVEVALAAKGAFSLFTDRIGSWWPTATHSRSLRLKNAAAVDVTMEPEVGGRVYETAPDGEALVWGRVTTYEPGRRVAFTWTMDRPEEQAGLVDVAFEDLGDGRTRVTLTHSGWEKLGEEGSALREQYHDGWNPVLAAFLDAA